MPSNNKVALIGALALSGCSGGWWHDQPAAAAPMATAPIDGNAPYGRPSNPASADAYPPIAEVASVRPDDGQSGAPYAAPPAGNNPARQRAKPVAASVSDYPPPKSQSSVRYDNVGIAAWSANPGTVAGAHPTLPPGSFVEVTALDTGKTILVPITAQSRPGREIELSGAAARELGLNPEGGQAGVRVRTVNATGADLAALSAGRPAPQRPDTPPVLLNALRRKLTGAQGQAGSDVTPPLRTVQTSTSMPMAKTTPRPSPRAPTPKPKPQPTAVPSAATGGFYVQVAAIADAGRAQSVARSIGGTASRFGNVTRVRIGPFKDRAAAQAARDGAARRGYGDARIVRPD